MLVLLALILALLNTPEAYFHWAFYEERQVGCGKSGIQSFNKLKVFVCFAVISEG